MAISYRSVSSAGVEAHTLTITKPSGVVDDDILLAFVIGTSPITAAIVAPAGWTEICNNLPGSSEDVYVFWKRASSEGASYDFTCADNQYLIGAMVAYSGCIASGSPVDVYSNTAYIVSDTTVRAASVTTTYANDMLVFLGWAYFYTSTPPASFTERLDTEPASLARDLYISDLIQASAGASGDKDATITSATTYKHAVLIALRVAPTTYTQECAATSASVGSTVRTTSKPLPAVSASVGALLFGNSYAVLAEGVASAVGALTTSMIYGYTLSAVSAATGALTRITSKTLSATSAATGALSRITGKIVSAVSTAVGALTKESFLDRTLGDGGICTINPFSTGLAVVGALSSGSCRIHIVSEVYEGLCSISPFSAGSARIQAVTGGEVRVHES